MFLDARQVEAGSVLDADVCIVGAGAAGIGMAREFIGSPVRLLLLESGDFDYDEKTQSLYEGKSSLSDYSLVGTRARFFGGSTNWWGGYCLPLDAIDFQKLSGLDHTGWPFAQEELAAIIIFVRYYDSK